MIIGGTVRTTGRSMDTKSSVFYTVSNKGDVTTHGSSMCSVNSELEVKAMTGWSGVEEEEEAVE